MVLFSFAVNLVSFVKLDRKKGLKQVCPNQIHSGRK